VIVAEAPATGAPPVLLPLIQDAAAAHGVDPALLAAVARAGSDFDPDAVSSVGAVGLMQLMPAIARALGVSDPRDPAQSLHGGAAHLRAQIDAFDGDLALALAAYRAGPGAVLRHGGIPAYSDTRAYVPRVLGFYHELRAGGFGPSAADGGHPDHRHGRTV
jgi:soluble lytic murein transglycosylase-like protein